MAEVPCDSSISDRCQTCDTDVNNCVTCSWWEPYALATINGVGTCYHLDELFNLLYKPGSTANKVGASSPNSYSDFADCPAGCEYCFDDASTCGTMPTCNPGEVLFSEDGVGTHCSVQDVNGKGPDPDTNYLSRCSDSNCQKCATSIDTCTQCNGGYGVDSSGACSDTSSLQGQSIGLNFLTGMIVDCAQGSCISCGPNYSSCDECDAAYLNIQGKCYFMNSIPAASSGTQISPLKEDNPACTTANCHVCEINQDLGVQVCKMCKNSFVLAGSVDYYLDTSLQCKPKGEIVIADGQGFDPIKYMVSTCADTNCAKCMNDIAVCIECLVSGDPAQQTYLLAEDGRCYLQADIPPFYGIDTTKTNTLTSCESSTCMRCAADSTVCTDGTLTNTCTSSSLGCTECYDNDQDGSCVACSDDPSGSQRYFDVVQKDCVVLDPSQPFGLTSSYPVQVVVQCMIPRCLSCSQDNTGCDVCEFPYTFQDGACSTMIPLGEGVGDTPDQVVSCDQSNCKSCFKSYLVCDHPCADINCAECADSNVCTVCSTTDIFPNLSYFLHQDSKCYSPANFPTSYGKDLANQGKLAMCTAAHCTKCADDNTVCQECEYIAGSSTYYKLQGDQCVQQSAGMGLDSTTGQMVPCSDPHCIDCADDYKTCVICDYYNKYYKGVKRRTTIPVCLNKDTFPAKMGPDIDAKDVKTCTRSDCVKCSDDYRICSMCNLQLYLDRTDPALPCYSLSQFPPKYGIDKSSYSVAPSIKPCEDPNCEVCSYSHLTCTKCSSSTILAPLLGKCYQPGQYPDRYGMKPKSNELIPCNDPECLDCHEHFFVCKQCDNNLDLYLGKCGTIKQTKLLPIPLFDQGPNHYQFMMPDKTLSDNIVQYFLPKLKNGDSVYANPSAFNMASNSQGFEITITFPEGVDKADLIIDRLQDSFVTSSSSNIVQGAQRVLLPSLTDEEKQTLNSINFPLSVTDMANYKSNLVRLADTMTVFTKIAVIMRIIANIVLPVSSVVSAFAIDKMFSHLTLASAQASERFAIMRVGTKNIQHNRNTLIPFLNFDSIRKNTANGHNCSPTVQMVMADIGCDYLYNYGSNSAGLVIILAAMILMDLLFFGFDFFFGDKVQSQTISGKKSKPTVLIMTLYLCLKTYGLQFFCAKLEAVILESNFFTAINLYTYSGDVLGGLLVGLLFMIYMATQIWGTWGVVNECIHGIEVDRRDPVSLQKLDVVKAYIDPRADSYKDRVFGLMFSGIKASLGKKGVYFLYASMVRMFLLGFVLGFLIETSLTMAIFVIVVDLTYLVFSGYYLKLQPRLSLLDNILEFLPPIFNVIYYLFSAISLAPKVKSDIGFDTYLLVLVAIFFALTLLAVAVAVVLAVIYAVKFFMNPDITPLQSLCQMPSLFNRNRTLTMQQSLLQEARRQQGANMIELVDADPSVLVVQQPQQDVYVANSVEDGDNSQPYPWKSEDSLESNIPHKSQVESRELKVSNFVSKVGGDMDHTPRVD